MSDKKQDVVECEKISSGEILEASVYSTIIPFFSSPLPTRVCFNVQFEQKNEDQQQNTKFMRIVAAPSMNENCKLSIDDVILDVVPYKSSVGSTLVFISSTASGEQTISVNCNGEPAGIVSVSLYDHVLNYPDQLVLDQLVLDNKMNILFTAMTANNQLKLPTLDIQFDVPLNKLQDDMELADDMVNVDAKPMESEAIVESKAIARRLLDSIDTMDFDQFQKKIAEAVDDADEEFQQYLDQQYNASDIDSIDIDSLLPLLMPSATSLMEEIVVAPTVTVSLKGEIPSSDFVAYAMPLDGYGNEISFVGDDIKQVHVSVGSDYMLHFENKKDEVIRFTLSSDVVELNQDYIKGIEDDLHGMIPLPDGVIDEMIEEAFDAENVDKASVEGEQLNGSESIFGTLLLVLFLFGSVVGAFIIIKRAICNLLRARRSQSEEQEASAITYYQMEEDDTYPQICVTEIAL